MDQVERFLRLDGVQGTSKVKGYGGWVDLLSAELAAPRADQGDHRSRTVEPVNLLTVKMKADSAYSSRLMQLAVSGALIPTGDLDVRNLGKDAYLITCHFTGMIINVHQHVEQGEEDAPFHRITFGYTTITSERC